MERIKLIFGDCIEQMHSLARQNIKVDMVLTDLPYGITACAWDKAIPVAGM